MKPTTNIEISKESAAVLDKIAKLRRFPDDMLTINMNGKMQGFNSLSGSCTVEGCNCDRRIKLSIEKIRSFSPEAAAIVNRYLLPSSDKNHISSTKCAKLLIALECPVCICVFCYANKAQSWQDGARIKFTANHHILNDSILTPDQLPCLPRFDHNFNKQFRFNAEGDCQSVNQAVNEFNICKNNPDTFCASWTKNPGYYERAYILNGGSVPENFNGVLSSSNINQPDIDLFNYYSKKCPGLFKKLFTVVTKEWAIEHGIVFNCCTGEGEKHCKDCQICYTVNDVVFIWEILR